MDAIILRTFEEPVVYADGRRFVASIAGRPGPDGRWEAWIEFVPTADEPVLRSTRETTQSNLASLERWARGVSRVFLEGSLERTLLRDEVPVQARRPAAPDRPVFDGPAKDLRHGKRPAPDDVALNPILHYARGEADLRERLSELASSELRAIVLAYHLDEDAGVDVHALDRTALEELVVAGGRRRAL